MGEPNSNNVVKAKVNLGGLTKKYGYIINWRDLDTGEMQKIRSGTNEKAVAQKIVDSKWDELSRKILCGDYYTNEKKIREYINVKSEETEKARNRQFKIGNLQDNTGASETIACRKVGISEDNARKGVAVINEIDRMDKNCDYESANLLRMVLNKSVTKAYTEITKTSEKRCFVNDGILMHTMTSLARAFDERCEYKGGETHRNDCMSLLKQLSARFDEWRASE